MAFKKISDFNEERYSGFFMLSNDGDSEDVVFMYRNIDDVLVTDAHYIKSPDYNGYVHCIGRGCPACAKGIRKEPKLFIPMYVMSKDQILFWDRNVSFQTYTLDPEVFSKYPNPNDFVFSITRRGAAGDRNTRYEIQAIARNTDEFKYDAICKKLNASFPDYFENVVKTWDSAQYRNALNSDAVESASGADDMPEYKLTPRNIAKQVELPDTLVDDSVESVDKVQF